jgi:hypothetical protein
MSKWDKERNNKQPIGAANYITLHLNSLGFPQISLCG